MFALEIHVYVQNVQEHRRLPNRDMCITHRLLFRYEALKYVSFAVQTLAKSAKALPVSVLGVLGSLT
jgi:hypothetical protein